MKTRIATLSLLTVCCLMLAVAPAMADTVFYDNGPTSGTADGWTINFGFSVSDSYTNAPGFTSVSDISIIYWDLNSSDVVTSIDAQFGSSSFGGALNTLTHGTNTLLGTNQYGYELFRWDWNGQPGLTDIPIGPGGGYMTLSNACSTSGCSISNPIYWDENSGPSTAYENTIGSIPSESFTLSGEGGTPPPTTPEPSSIMLFGSGILGLAGVLRRKLTR
jgi:hypothetical protein